MNASTGTKKTHPILWVPTAYFAMGTIYMMLNNTTTVMYKRLGIPEEDVAFWAGALGFPYVVKVLWAPIIEMFKTKKFFVVVMQLVLAVLLALVAVAIKLPSFLAITVGLFFLAAFAGATQDVSTDGVYVTALNRKDQARFTGFQSLCWSIGPIFSTGVLVQAAGIFYEGGMTRESAWQLVMFIIAGTTGLVALYHAKFLPAGAKAKDAPSTMSEGFRTTADAFKTLFQKKGIWMMLSFAFLYRFGQGLLDKMGLLFMINDRENGGLGLTDQAVGAINGTYGMVGFLAGGILGGFFVAKMGLNRKILFFLCCMMNIPNFTYIYLGMTQPEDLVFIGSVVTLEKFGFGFGAVGHMIYMMQQLAPGKYKTTHYAFGTALMGFCMMFTGMLSGYLKVAIGGYVEFFWFVMVATIPSFVVTWLAPFHITDENAHEYGEDSGDGPSGGATPGAAGV